MRAFIRQLSSTAWSKEKSVHASLKSQYREARLKATKLTLSDCHKIILELVSDYPRTTLVIDALDECEKEQRLELVKILDDLLDKSYNPLRVFISSRPDGGIKEILGDRVTLEVNAENNSDDIAKYVDNEIEKHRRWKTISPEFRETIRNTLLQKSKGM